MSQQKISTKEVGTITTTTANVDNSVALNSTCVGACNEVCPESFKRFLIERNEDIDRLGISFDSEDGYLPESDSEETELINEQHRFSSILFDKDASPPRISSVWERVSLLL